jgi:hypothetical protein
MRSNAIAVAFTFIVASRVLSSVGIGEAQSGNPGGRNMLAVAQMDFDHFRIAAMPARQMSFAAKAL